MSILISAASWLRVPYIVCVWWGPRSAGAIALTFWGTRFLLLFDLHVCNRWGLRVDHTVGLGPTCCTFYKTPSPLPLEKHLVDPYRHISVYCMKPKALYYC